MTKLHKDNQVPVNSVFLFNENGKDIVIPREAWTWSVVYSDETVLRQFDDGRFHQFREIDQEQVEIFGMDNSHDPSRRFDMFVKPGAEIFHFYRNITLRHGDPDEMKARVYCFGWKRGEQTAYFYILPNGNLVMSDHDISISEIVDATD